MKNKIIGIVIILGFVCSTILYGLNSDDIYKKYCSRGKQGYYAFIDSVHFTQKKVFWNEFVSLIRGFQKNHRFDKVKNCREFWENYKEDEFFDIHRDEINEQLDAIDTIFSDLRQPSGPGEFFDCPPYLNALEFTIVFAGTYQTLAQVIEIVQPDGYILNTSNAQEQYGSTIITVPHPQAGVWHIIPKDKDTRFTVKTVLQEVKFLAPNSPVRRMSKHTIKFKAYDPVKNIAFKPLTQFPPDAALTIKIPGNGSELLPAVLSPEEPGVFISDTPFQFRLPGEYRIQLNATVINNTGTPQSVLTSGKARVLVNDSIPVKLVLEEPQQGIRSFFGCIRRQVVVGFYNENRTRQFNPRDLLKPGLTKIRANVTFLDIHSWKTIETVDFMLEFKGNYLGAALKTKLPVTDMLNLLLHNRSAKFTIHLNNDYLKKDYFFPALSSLPRYEFLLNVREGFAAYFIVMAPMALLLLIFLRHTVLLITTVRSKDIPVLVYRNNSYIPNDRFDREIEIDKKKLVFKPGDVFFDIPPDKKKKWSPYMKIIRNTVPRGVCITIYYEKFNTNAGKQSGSFSSKKAVFKRKRRYKDKTMFRQETLRTTDPHRTGKHLIEGLKQREMIFELRIKGSNPGVCFDDSDQSNEIIER